MRNDNRVPTGHSGVDGRPNEVLGFRRIVGRPLTRKGILGLYKKGIGPDITPLPTLRALEELV